MPNPKPLTKPDLVEALKELGVATQADIQASEERVKKYVADVVTESNKNIIVGVEAMFKERDRRLEQLDKGQAQIKDDLKSLKADLAGKASRAELKELSERVDRYHPTH